MLPKPTRVTRNLVIMVSALYASKRSLGRARSREKVASTWWSTHQLIFTPLALRMGTRQCRRRRRQRLHRHTHQGASKGCRHCRRWQLLAQAALYAIVNCLCFRHRRHEYLVIRRPLAKTSCLRPYGSISVRRQRGGN